MIAVYYVFGFTNGYVSDISTASDIQFITIGDVESGGSYYGSFAVNVGTRPANLASKGVESTYAQDGWFSRS